MSRNQNPNQVSYLRGKRYNGEKQAHGAEQGGRGNQHTVVSTQNEDLPKTSEKLAKEYNIGRATIERDGQFAAAVDTLAQAGIEPQVVSALVGR